MPFGFGNRGGRRGGGKGRLVIAGILVLMAVIGYFSKEKVTNPETGESYRRAMNVDQQKALGLQAVKEMIPQMGGAADPQSDPAARLVSEVGRRLVSNSTAAQTPFADNFNFFLINDASTINAFALPGGQVSITRGLFDKLDTEAQLAGVLGHEIVHVVAEHSAQQMAKGQLGQLIATAVGVAASENSNNAMIASQMANQMIQLKYGRDDERQSDDVGMKYMIAAGYNPEGMRGVMKVLIEAGKGGRQPAILASHPNPEERLKTVEQFLETNKEKLSKMNLTDGKRLR